MSDTNDGGGAIGARTDRADAGVLGRILMLQSALQEAPDERCLAQLLARGLVDLPGIEGCAVWIGKQRGASGSFETCDEESCRERGRVHELRTCDGAVGIARLEVSDPRAAAPYDALISNTANFAALQALSWRHARALRESDDRLEAAVEERTAELRETVQRLDLVLRSGDLGTWDWHVPTGHVILDDQFARVLGLDPGEVAPNMRSWDERIHPEDEPRVRHALRAHFDGETETYESEHRLLHSDGHWIWVLDKGRVIERDGSGRPIRMCGTYLDVSERRRAEDRRRLDQERFRSLLEHTSECFYMFEPSEPIPTDLPTEEQVRRLYRGTIVECNDLWARTYGYRQASDVVGMSLLELHGGDDDPANVAFLREWIESGYHIRDALSTEVDRAGNEIWYANNVLGIVDGGRLLRAWGTQVDVTEREKAKVAIEQERSLLSELIASLPGVFYLFDRHGRFLRWNRNFESATGYRGREMRGLRLGDLFAEKDRARVMAEIERVFDEGDSSVEADLVHESGECRPFYFTGRRILVDGAPCLVGTAMDVTEWRRAEREREDLQAQLNHVQKVEAIGRLAGGVAHDLNNMLTPILGFGEMLYDDLAASDYRRRGVSEILRAGRRARDLVRQLLAFSRKQILEFRPLDLNEILRNFQELLRRTIREDVAIKAELAPDLPTVLGDAGQIEQVIMNLSVNAADAMPDGGRLTLRTRRVTVHDGDPTGPPDAKPGIYASFAVTDTGCGMDPESVARVFEPFYSTKGDQGTGLGLATVYGIVKQHGGTVRVSSAPGEGSTFELFLPESEEVVRAAEPDAPVAFAPAGSETVMLVEDNDQVRDLVRTILGRQGYRVLVAQNGEDALRMLEAHDGPLDLLLTDVVMPGIGGHALFERAAADRPNLKVLYMSGYSERTVMVRDAQGDGVGHLQKPFSVQDLATRVREALERG